MKYNKTIFGVLAFILLLLQTPHRLCAETTLVPADTLRTPEIQIKGPQTPEELLQVIKTLFANPDVDGQEFIEQQFGFARTDWGKPLPGGGIERRGLLYSRINKLSIPYHVDEGYLDRQNKLYKLIISFYRNPDFRITPDLTQKILGPPTKIWVSSPKGDMSGSYRITYRYETLKYYFDVRFQNRAEDGSQEMRSKFREHTPEQILNEQARRKSFEKHKDYQALAMELDRTGRP